MSRHDSILNTKYLYHSFYQLIISVDRHSNQTSARVSRINQNPFYEVPVRYLNRITVRFGSGSTSEIWVRNTSPNDTLVHRRLFNGQQTDTGVVTRAVSVQITGPRRAHGRTGTASRPEYLDGLAGLARQDETFIIAFYVFDVRVRFKLTRKFLFCRCDSTKR